MIWRLQGEEVGLGRRQVFRRKKIALSVVAASFWLVVAFILFEASRKFISQKPPRFSWLGVGILLLALVVNPFLAWGKYHYGKKLDAPSLKYDAIDTLICQYQTVVVLTGSHSDDNHGLVVGRSSRRPGDRALRRLGRLRSHA